MDRMLLYDLLYALTARDGREDALFGRHTSLAREAFVRSLAGRGFPELWFELPLAGEPWMDLHVLWSRAQLDGATTLDSWRDDGISKACSWFAACGPGARQLALSWDAGSAGTDLLCRPAVQLLRRTRDTQLVCDFLTALGRSDAVSAYRLFEGGLPEGWFACYTGVFSQRTEPFLRVECIPAAQQQSAYAADPTLLAAHLRQLGMTELGETLLARCRMLANSPFRLEFQFDVAPDGSASPTFAASVRFAPPAGKQARAAFDADGVASGLMQRVEAWDLADERWQLLGSASFSKRLGRAGESWHLWCFPAFLKLRWRDGEPVDAKTYLMAGASESQAEDRSC